VFSRPEGDAVTGPTESAAFVEECGCRLAVSGRIQSSGVSRVFACTLHNRLLKVGTNGSFYWVATELRWKMPSDVEIMWAPVNSYKRAKLFELEAGPPSTGDAAFDDSFVIVGIGTAGERFAPQVPVRARSALVEAVAIRPDVRWLAPQLERRLHIKAEPPLRRNDSLPGFVALGTELFTPAEAAAAAQRSVQLAEQIESAR
jgi:hypothetical protein